MLCELIRNNQKLMYLWDKDEKTRHGEIFLLSNYAKLA